MKASLDCIPCLVRQSLEMARVVTDDTVVHERILREVLSWAVEMDMGQPPPVMAQRIHRKLCKITGTEDPYREAKAAQNRMAMRILGELESEIGASDDPLITATRIAIAGNVIDIGVNGDVTVSNIRASITKALTVPLVGDQNNFTKAAARAEKILYLCDNAGEIVFDSLLIKALGPSRVTAVVRGAPILNDTTLADATSTGLDQIVEVMDNGSDAPGTLLDDCSDKFRQKFMAADLIIAKGQGNFETLSDVSGPVFFLFQAKCPVIAKHAGVPLQSHVIKTLAGEEK